MITVANIYTYCEKQNDRAKAKWWSCEKTNDCILFKKGKCACHNEVFSVITCPNATYHQDVSPTKRAKSHTDWILNKQNTIVKNAEPEDKKMSKVYGYIYLPFPYLVGGSNAIEKIENKYFISEELFDADFVQELVKFRPMSWFGGEILDYQKKVVPKIIQQLKEEFPKTYKEWTSKYSDTANQFQDYNHVGRTVYIKSLPNGAKVKDNNKNYFVKNGNSLVCEGYHGFLLPFRAKTATVKIEIDNEMKTVVTDEMDIGDSPEFVD